jgi:uncharacterized alpha-E superfamily protein
MKVAERITYYAIIDRWASRDDPAGLVRRRRPPTGGFRDEALTRDSGWQFTPLIVQWERAESTDDLVEVTEDEAKQIIERFRARWGAPG